MRPGVPARAASQGFTLAELLIALVIIATMAAVLIPTVLGRLTGGQAAVLVSQMTGIRDAISAHRSDVGRNPGRLRQLTTAPVAGDKDTCGRNIPTSVFAQWEGPYLEHPVPAAGITVGTAVIPDTVRRRPAAGTSSTDTLWIVAGNVDSLVAVEMDRNLDGNGDLTAGTITWTTNGNDTVKFNFPSTGC